MRKSPSRADLGVVEREVPEVAADAEGRARDRSVAHRAGDVAAHAFGQAERQVARGARGDAVDRACRRARAGPGSARRGRSRCRRRVRQVALSSPLASALAKLADATLTLIFGAAPSRRALDLPASACASSRSSGTSRSSNTPGRSSWPALHVDARLAAGLGRLELQRGVAEAGPADRVGLGRRPGGEREAAQLALDAIARGRIERPVPARAQLRDRRRAGGRRRAARAARRRSARASRSRPSRRCRGARRRTRRR